jgi:hypothetical protein
MRIFAFACLMSLATVASANADCYDVFGCTNAARFHINDLMSGPNCEFLYTMRNGIYAEHGYCFHTARGRATFGNQGCVSGDANARGLNATERYNAGVILQAERAKGCVE